MKTETLTLITGTTNMAVIVCVEEGQSDTLYLNEFVNFIQEQISDFFDKATYNNYHVNVLNVLVKSVDEQHGIAHAFVLPDTLFSYPTSFDTNYVVPPWMVENILAQADSIYNFADFDSDGDEIVDFCMFQVAKMHTESYGSGTTGLSINDYYITNDIGAQVVI